jgi:hypothetical protein
MEPDMPTYRPENPIDPDEMARRRKVYVCAMEEHSDKQLQVSTDALLDRLTLHIWKHPDGTKIFEKARQDAQDAIQAVFQLILELEA